MKIKLIITALLVQGMLSTACAQYSKPSYRQFFFNPYLNNPAFVATNSGTEVNLVYKRQAVNFEGGPVTAGITLQSAMRDERVMIGFSAVSNREAVFDNTAFLGTFGYVVPIDAKQSLRFGISAGVGLNSMNLTAEELN